MATPSITQSPAQPSRAADPNHIDLAQYRGEITVCPFCKPAARLNGLHCDRCMDRGYIAKCTNCDATGVSTSAAVWDGGKTSHSATCTPCGGTGSYPVTKAMFDAQESARVESELAQLEAATAPETASTPDGSAPATGAPADAATPAAAAQV